MNTKHAFGSSLKKVRKARGLTQEDFSDVSSRTYLSTLERGLKSPTLEKVEGLSSVLQIHPLTLLALTYVDTEKKFKLDKLLELVAHQVNVLERPN